VIAYSVGLSVFRFMFCISIMAGGVCILQYRCVIQKPIVSALPDFTNTFSTLSPTAVYILQAPVLPYQPTTPPPSASLATAVIPGNTIT
jgi:hypothetical protein